MSKNAKTRKIYDSPFCTVFLAYYQIAFNVSADSEKTFNDSASTDAQVDSDSTVAPTPSPDQMLLTLPDFKPVLKPQLRFTSSNMKFLYKILTDAFDQLCYFDKINQKIESLTEVHQKLKIPDEAAIEFYEQRQLAHAIISRFFTAPKSISDDFIDRIENNSGKAHFEYVQLLQFVNIIVQFDIFSYQMTPGRRSNGGTPKRLKHQPLKKISPIFTDKNNNSIAEKKKNQIESLSERDSELFVEDIGNRVTKLINSNDLQKLSSKLEDYSMQV